MKNQNSEIEHNDAYEIDVTRMFKTIWSKKVMILASAFFFAAILFVISYYFTDYTYTAEGVLYVSNRDDSSSSTSISKSDIDTAKTLSTTYIEILKTRDFLETVSELTEEKLGWEEIKKLISVSAVNETELISISVTTENPDLSFNIAECVIKAAPEKLLSVYEAGKVRVVNKVHYPEKANGRGVVTKTVVGFALGMFLGLAYAVLYVIFDKKIHNGAQVSEKFGLSVLGEIPGAHSSSDKKKHKEQNDLQNILSDNSLFNISEVYKSIRTNVMFSSPKTEKGKVITITSPAPSEGKTTTATNIAITFAQTKAKVLLVDCDLRKAKVHRYLQVEKGIGITNVLCGYASLEEAIKKDVRENLDVLSAGNTPPNPAELLNSVQFDELIEELKGRYDYIIIDTPPVTLVTDATVVMPKTHGVVLVVREGQTTLDLIEETVESIGRTEAKLLGVVVSDSTEKNTKYGYKYKSKYSYGYGEVTNGKK